MESTSGQISLQLPSFCASLKTKNKTDSELTFELTITDGITYLCTQWIMLTVSYICILFSDRTCLMVIFLLIHRSLLYRDGSKRS